MRNPFASIWSLWRWTRLKPLPCRCCGVKFHPERLCDGICVNCVIDKLCNGE